MTVEGAVTVHHRDTVAVLEFSHPKANSLPLSLLHGLADQVRHLGADEATSVIELRSAGDKTFCAGASFDEFKRVASEKEATDFFSGFARLIVAMKQCPKMILTRVQGKAVGGGVGVIAASDYVCANNSAAVRLSEYELDIGPFTVGPAVSRRIGTAAFSDMSTDCEWRDADWCLQHGLFAKVAADADELDAMVEVTANHFAARAPEATKQLKMMLWQGTEDWESLLAERAAITARLLMAKKHREGV